MPIFFFLSGWFNVFLGPPLRGVTVVAAAHSRPSANGPGRLYTFVVIQTPSCAEGGKAVSRKPLGEATLRPPRKGRALLPMWTSARPARSPSKPPPGALGVDSLIQGAASKVAEGYQRSRACVTGATPGKLTWRVIGGERVGKGKETLVRTIWPRLTKAAWFTSGPLVLQRYSQCHRPRWLTSSVPPSSAHDWRPLPRHRPPF